MRERGRYNNIFYRGAFGGVGGDFGAGSRVSRVNGVLNASLKNPLNDPAGKNSFGGGNNDHVPGRSRCRGRSHWPRSSSSSAVRERLSERAAGRTSAAR